MKKKLNLIIALIAITATAHAQKPNLKVYNDSDPANGCDYVVVPLVAPCDHPQDNQIAYPLTDSILKGRTSVFTEMQLINLYGSHEMCYVGALVINVRGGLKVCFDKTFDWEENGDCGGGYAEANYDDTFNPVMAAMYITDEQ